MYELISGNLGHPGINSKFRTHCGIFLKVERNFLDKAGETTAGIISGEGRRNRRGSRTFVRDAKSSRWPDEAGRQRPVQH